MRRNNPEPGMNTLAAIVGIVIMVLQWLIWLLILQAILSWLIAFNVVNTYNGFVRGVLRFCDAVTEQLLRPIRRFCPTSAASICRRWC